MTVEDIIEGFHALEPSKNRKLNYAPIKICNNVWLGADVTVLQGVTIGE